MMLFGKKYQGSVRTWWFTLSENSGSRPRLADSIPARSDLLHNSLIFFEPRDGFLDALVYWRRREVEFVSCFGDI